MPRKRDARYGRALGHAAQARADMAGRWRPSATAASRPDRQSSGSTRRRTRRVTPARRPRQRPARPAPSSRCTCLHGARS